MQDFDYWMNLITKLEKKGQIQRVDELREMIRRMGYDIRRLHEGYDVVEVKIK